MCHLGAGPPRRYKPAMDLHDDPMARLRALVLSLPGTHEELTWGHPTFRVGAKMFGAAGAAPGGEVTMSCKCTKDLQPGILARGPGYFRPDYVGVHGWLGIRLDGSVPWSEIEEHVRRAWALTAPKRLQR